MIMYRTGYGQEIEELVVQKRTPARVSFVAILSHGQQRVRTEAIKSEYHQWHDTRQDAINYLIERARQRVAACQRRLDEAKELLASAQRITP